jgi:hypothetical protein
MLCCTIQPFDNIFSVDNCLDVLGNCSISACRMTDDQIGANNVVYGNPPMPFLSMRVTKSASVRRDGEEV